MESRFDHKAKNKHSSAKGLFQITRATENELRKRYDINGDIYNPYTNALLGAYNTKETIRYYKNKGKKVINDLDLYFGHFMGVGEAYRFSISKPEKSACEVAERTCNAHLNMFKDKTVEDIKLLFQIKLDKAKVL